MGKKKLKKKKDKTRTMVLFYVGAYAPQLVATCSRYLIGLDFILFDRWKATGFARVKGTVAKK